MPNGIHLRLLSSCLVISISWLFRIKDNGFKNLKKMRGAIVMDDDKLIQIKKHLTHGNVFSVKRFLYLHSKFN